MSTLINFFKKPIVQATLIGAFGGMAPKLVDLVPKLFANQYPSMGMFYGFLLLALFGAIIVIIYHEENFQKALILGAGAPALISALIAQAAAPTQNTSGFFLPVNFSIVSTAYAQDRPKMDTIKFVVTQDESALELSSFWILADSVTLNNYKQKGDTIIVTYPSTAKELQLNLPKQVNGVTYSVSELSKTKVQQLKISNDQQTKDFWQTFGGKSVPQYRLEKKKTKE